MGRGKTAGVAGRRGWDVMELQTAVPQHCYHPCTYKGEGEAGSGVGGRVWGSSQQGGSSSSYEGYQHSVEG